MALSGAAQSLSVGAKTGATHWFSINNSKNLFRKATDGQTLGWDKELFGRYALKTGLAFELGVGHAAREMKPAGHWFTCGAGCERDSVYMTGTRDYYELNISAQQRVLTVKKRFSNYMGLIARPGSVITERTVAAYSRANEAVAPDTNTYHYRQFSLALGLSNTSEYSINRHLTAYATFSASINMLGHLLSHDYSDANARIGGIIGLGYRL
jgi:hypothetical protein